MELQEKFDAAVINAKKLTEKPSNDILLKLYALYKQATDGDVSGDRPGGFDFKAIAKYNAWEAQKGNDKNSSMQQYIDLVESLS